MREFLYIPKATSTPPRAGTTGKIVPLAIYDCEDFLLQGETESQFLLKRGESRCVQSPGSLHFISLGYNFSTMMKFPEIH